jgi:hypothetical protein
MFSFSKLAAAFGLTMVVGIAAYAVAYQFNDGKMTRAVIGAVFLGMSFPSLIIGGTMRVFRRDLQKYFAITAATCLLIGFLLIGG